MSITKNYGTDRVVDGKIYQKYISGFVSLFLIFLIYSENIALMDGYLEYGMNADEFDDMGEFFFVLQVSKKKYSKRTQ